MMNRRNHGRSSGVILDLCVDHGVWFDADELARVLAWIEKGGETYAKKLQAAEIRATVTRTNAGPKSAHMPPDQIVTVGIGSVVANMLLGLFD